MSWFTSFFQPSKEEAETTVVLEHLREVFSGLEVKKETLVSSKQPAVNRLRFLDLTNKLLSYKDEYTKEHVFQLQQQISNVLEKIDSFESSFKFFKFDDQQLLNNEKKLTQLLQIYVVHVITSVLKTNIEKHRLSFLQQGKHVQTKFQQIQEFQKQVQIQQEKADVETSIQTQKEMEEVFEQCFLLNAQRRRAASELLKELKTIDARPKEKGESLKLEQELTARSELCNADVEKLLKNFEKKKAQIQASLEEKAVVQKQQQRLKAAENHKLKLEELAMSHESAKTAQQASFEALMKEIEEGKFFDATIAQYKQEYQHTAQLVERLQDKMLKMLDQIEEVQKNKQKAAEDEKEVNFMLKDILEVSQSRVHNLEATSQVLKQTAICLKQIYTLAVDLDNYLNAKVEECSKLFGEYWKESLVEHVNLTCEMWSFLQARILRKKKDIQHVSSEIDNIKRQLQDATERENLTDVARFQKKKKKQELVLEEVIKELERLMNKQGDTMLPIHQTLDHLKQLNEPSYAAKIEALTNPTPSSSVL